MSLLLLLWSAPASANPWDLFGAGSRAAGLAGAASTLSDDGFAVFYNPAALTLNHGATISLGFAGSVPSLEASGDLAGVGAAANVSSYSALSMAATLPLRRVFPQLRRELTFGVAIGVPQAGSAAGAVRSPSPDEPYFPVMGGWGDRMMVMLGAGAEILPGRLSAGIAILGLTDLGGQITVSNGDAPVASSTQTFQTDIAVSAGFLYKPTEWFSLALHFRDEQILRVEQRLDLPGVDGAVAVPYLLRSNSFFVPRQFLLGLAGKPLPWLTVAFDTAFLQSSRLAQGHPITELSLVDAPQSEPLTIKARDVFIFRGALELTGLAEVLTLRLGYAFLPRFLDGDQTEHVLMDNDRHTVSASLTVAVGPGGDDKRALKLGGHFHAIVLPESTFGSAGGPLTSSGVVMGGGLTATLQF